MIFDCSTRFFIQDHNQKTTIRGATVNLRNSFVEALNGRDYPEPVTQLLGESLAASVLMSTHLKNSAKLTIQAKGSGELSMLMAENTMHRSNTDNDDAESFNHIRAVARVEDTENLAASNPHELLFNGQMAITIEPEGGQRYQGIVDLSKGALNQCLVAYFAQSEQIETYLFLTAQAEQAGGILLQKIPQEGGSRDESSLSNDSLADNQWLELIELCQTLKQEELFELPAQDVLYRLFHQHTVTLHSAESVNFACSCSRQRTGEALSYISPHELASILEEEGEIVMDCEFCSARYRFTQQDIEQLFAEGDNSLQ